jgi:hypothetical protein
MLRVEEVASLFGMTIESVDRVSPSKLPRKAAQHGAPQGCEYRTSDVAAAACPTCGWSIGETARNRSFPRASLLSSGTSGINSVRRADFWSNR